MNQITAPYGFVPLANQVYHPEWLAGTTPPPVHDVPFSDGICGTLEMEVEAETPIFARGRSQEFFQLSDKRYAIPGTSLRGCLRNIVEIVTFSRFSRVNDHRYAVRDLNNRHLYGQYMADIVKDARTGKGEPMPLVNAGWLRREGRGEDARYLIQVCDFAKFEYRSLMDVARQRGVRDFRPGEKQSSVNKYRTWGQANLDVEAKVEWKRPVQVGQRHMHSQFGKAIPAPGQARGTLVMTGQPARWVPDQVGRRPGAGSAKHHDFLFFETKKVELEVTRRVFEDFEFAHSDRGQQNRLGKSQTPNEEWAYWEERLEKGQKVPVFFLSEGNQVQSFGLAMMFRLPYKNSIHEAIGNVSGKHLEKEGLDFAEGLFGTVREDKNRAAKDLGFALKGRVGISHALAEGDPKPMGPVQAILGAPKASYYPNYVEQQPGSHGGQPIRDNRGNPVYQTWMDPHGAPRGWKRYRPLTETHIPKPPSGGDGRPLNLDKVGTTFRPLPAGTRFRAHIDVHNLKPAELGALLWAIELGGDEKARHTLGMARPLGFGRCKMRVTRHDLKDMADRSVDLAPCREAFAAWKPERLQSSQVKEFLALARPVSPDQARYQRLDPGQRVNEFTDAKKAGMALSSLVHHLGSAPAPAASITRASGTPVSAQPGSTVRAKVIEKTTKKGDPMFQVLGLDSEGILHPTSPKPPGLNVGEEHTFTIAASGKPLMLKWVDPNAPPPPPPKPANKPGQNRPGFRR